MKKLLMTLVLLPLMAMANTWTDESTGYTWYYEVSDGKAEIRNWYSCAVSPEPSGVLTIPSQINGYPVVSIGYDALEYCSGLTSVTIPEGVTSIGSWAFYGCSGLTSVSMPSSVTSIGSSAFRGCSGLTQVDISDLAAWCSIDFYGESSNPLYYSGKLYLNGVEVPEALVIPDGVGSVGDYAFYGCCRLTSVTIPSSVTSIGTGAFSGCSGLTSVTMPSGVTCIGSSAFRGCSGLTWITIPLSVTSIGSSAFYGCNGLMSVTIPSGVTSIESSVFYGCSGLTSVTIPSSVTSIGSSAFYGCSGLMSATIPSGVTSIGERAFSGCSGLTSLTIPEGVVSIGYEAFYDCHGLTSVTVPPSVTGIGYDAFEDCDRLTRVNINDLAAWCGIEFDDESSNPLYYAGKLYLNGVEVTGSLVIPDGVEIIGDYAFAGCHGLTSVTVPPSVTGIGYDAFEDCDRLTRVDISDLAAWCSIDFYDESSNPLYYAGKLYLNGVEVTGSLVIPDGVEIIGDYAFAGCRGLTSVTIPPSVTGIGYDAFEDCDRPTRVDISDLAAWCGIEFDGESSNPLYYSGKLYLNGVEVTGALVIPDGAESIGDYAFYGCRRLTSVTIPSSVTRIGSCAFYNCTGLTSVTLPTSVTSIGYSAFSGCTGLTSVTIPTGVTSIGSSAFSGCSGLTRVDVADLAKWCGILFSSFDANPLYYAHHLYLNGEEVKDLVIPSGVMSIGSSAFYGCSGLTSVTIPSSVMSIGYDAFAGCEFVWRVTAASLANWMEIEFSNAKANPCWNGADLQFADSYFSGDLVLPDGVTWIDEKTFAGCANLTTVFIPKTVTYVASGAFSGCKRISEIRVDPANKNYMSIDGVLYDKSLRNLEVCPNGYRGVLTIPASVGYVRSPENIGASSGMMAIALEEGNSSFCVKNGLLCSWDGKTVVACPGGLSELTFPEGISTVNFGVFSRCANLRCLIVPGSVTSIPRGAFGGCEGLQEVSVPFIGTKRGSGERFSSIFNAVPESLAVVTITDEVSIPNSAFEGCKHIKTVNLPIGVSSVGDSAFRGCESLRVISLPAGIAKIGASAFQSCTSLSEVVIPAGVSSIESSTFYGCTSLSKITLPVGLSEISSRAFMDCRGLYQINIPNTVSSIAGDAFRGCSRLGSGVVVIDKCLLTVNEGCPASVVIGKDVRLIASGAFDGCEDLQTVRIESQIEELPDGLFRYCSNLKSVILSDSIRRIGDEVFYECNALSSIVLPKGLQEIGYEAFAGCCTLSDVELPEGLLTIDEWAFEGCASMRTFKVPSTVVSLGFEEGEGCFPCGWWVYDEDVDDEEFIEPKLSTILVAAGNTMYAAYEGCLYTKDFKTLLRCPPAATNVKIRNGTKVVSGRAFLECGWIESIAVPEGVVCVGSQDDDGEVWSEMYDAFSGCVSLRSMSLPSTMVDVEVPDCGNLTAFSVASGNPSYMTWQNLLYTKDCKTLLGCPQGLRGAQIRDGVRRIGTGAFSGCRNITTLSIPATVVEIGQRPFWGCSTLTTIYYGGNAPEPSYYSDTELCCGLGRWEGPTEEELYAEWGLYHESYVYEPACCGMGGSVRQVNYLPVVSCPKRGTKGWGDEDVWQGRPLVFVDSIPAIATTYYELRFEANGGTTSPNSVWRARGERYGDLPIVERDGFVFRGWYTALRGGQKVSADATVTADITLYAHWKDVNQKDPVLVPGEGFEFDTGITDYTVSGLPTGLAYNRTTGMITGAASKPGEYAVKFTKSGAETEEMTIVVTAVPKITVEMAGVNAQSDTNGCKVTGAKEYLVGVKATLSVTVPTGTMFEGWFRDDQPWPDEATHLNKSVTYTMGKEDVALVAKFKKEVMTVGCTWLSEGVFTAGVAAGAEDGILLDDYVATKSGIKSIAVTKLPSGMTYNATKRIITGFPNKAGAYNVEIVVTAKSGAVEKQTIPLTVEALPAWAVGNFEGTVRCADGTHGTASFAVSAAGAISSGKLLEHGSNWTFTAKSYATTSITRGLEQDYVILADAKCGTVTRQVELHVMGCAVEGVAENAALAAGFFGDAELEFWRNVWKDADAKGVLAGIAGKYTYFLEDDTALPLNLMSAGALSGSAKIPARDNASVSFSTTVFASTNGVEAAFYVAPDAKKGYEEIYERFALVPESGEKEPGVAAHRNPGVVAVPEPYPGDSGNGTVSVSPAGGQVDAGKTVTVSATPDSKSVFVKWVVVSNGVETACEMSKLTLAMDGEHDVEAFAIFRSKGSFKEPVVAVETSEQAKFKVLELGVQFSAFVTVTDVENMKPVKWSAQNLPTGLRINAETGEISGVATAVNSKPVVITATSVANSSKTTFTLDIGAQDGKPAALPETAVGTFTGFVNDGTDNLGTFTFTSSEKGALSAKVIDAKGTVSFSGSGFAWSKDGRYGVALKTTKDETLSLTLNSAAGWDKDQLTGTYKATNGRTLGVAAQRNAFSKAWYFAAEGDETAGWTFSFTTDTKAAALTVTLKADGTTSVAGTLGAFRVSASGVANVGMMDKGALAADFAPVLTVGGKKKVLAIRTNLWFDRRNSHPEGIGEAKFVE